MPFVKRRGRGAADLWAAITISLNKGYSYDLRLRTWHCSSTLPCFIKVLVAAGEQKQIVYEYS